MASNCIFCKIVSGEIPSTKVFEDEKVLAFLDVKPAAKGHALIIPKKHYATLLDIPHEELKDVTFAVQKVGAAVMKALNAEGFNVIQSNKEAAGQVIPHVHFHVIPRKKDDGLNFGWKEAQHEKEEMQEYAKSIKNHL
ncbi:MAG: HIT family protein [Candidatus Diapherotrites archaeon]